MKIKPLTDYPSSYFSMRFVIALCLCLTWATSRAQDVDIRLQFHSAYMPQFTVREASDNNVQPIGIRLTASNYNLAPWEAGIHVYGGYGDVARASFGFNFAYLFAGRESHYFKIGLGLSRMDLEDVDANTEELGPHIGDVRFTSWGNEFKPYIEWEWMFSGFSSLFVQAGYRIINGERSVVTSVEPTNDPIVKNRITGRDETFFYSGAGFDIGAGISIIL